jgi:hypothetical protein
MIVIAMVGCQCQRSEEQRDRQTTDFVAMGKIRDRHHIVLILFK